MTEAAQKIRVGARWSSTPYVLDDASAERYGKAIESPPRRSPRRGIHDDEQAARTAGFSKPIAAGEQTVAVIAQFLADKFGMHFLRGGRIDIALTKPVFFGDTLISHVEVEAVEDGRATLRIKVENQRGESALIGAAALRIDPA
ncbi:MAG: MaoC family dehydratase [Candidatus Binatus sp.]|uniref:MaoC family dehydratase n=1 Tax=Candidatus Binatus sp. TaxID=2811406 RepID=UPI0027236A63|nr:MaoC family dehydratase [Candidatus Binatus sp.]MDO8434924.1 MaoC family dehydratase [Candidatus Binatus sp.]